MEKLSVGFEMAMHAVFSISVTKKFSRSSELKCDFIKRAFHCSRKTKSDTAKVVFLRHGQSLWNKIPTFSGWCDVPLTEHGIEQAREAGLLLNQRDFHFDIAYTSRLQRASITCETVVDTLGASNDTPIVSAWQLNERHYGSLQGRAKDDPALIAKYGEEQIKRWRREFYAAPPPLDESHPYFEPPPAPLTGKTFEHKPCCVIVLPCLKSFICTMPTESLADCQKRVLTYWEDSIVPSLRPDGNALFVAHANTIRAIASYLDDIPPENVVAIHIANSVPCVYHIDLKTGTAVATDHARTADSSRGQWLLSVANQRRLASKLGGSSEGFARSIFEAWDLDSDGVLTKDEIKQGLYSWKNDDRALSALVGKVWEELHKMDDSGPITIDKFQRYALLGAKKHNLPFFLH